MIFAFFVFFFLAFLFIAFLVFSEQKKGSLHSGKSKETRVTVCRDTDQPKFSSL